MIHLVLPVKGLRVRCRCHITDSRNDILQHGTLNASLLGRKNSTRKSQDIGKQVFAVTQQTSIEAVVAASNLGNGPQLL